MMEWWAGADKHLNKCRIDFWRRDCQLEEEIDRIIINTGIDSSDEETSAAAKEEEEIGNSDNESVDTSATASADEATMVMNVGVEQLLP
ncbi:hypothetical protein L9F63_019346 [Diploptera punctata]|uniref:Uncharacterized protein n=1 Tax=Diploptera punctata TaxID=6984 RepID=A0AAD7ZWF6_DIPPU|nr:hypothetical protein L9F63_019346 [Diploptera punctata]